MEREPTGLEIAVIGMAGRFPGAESVSDFWRMVVEGRDAIRTFTGDEVRSAGVPEATAGHPDFVPAWGALPGVEDFDAGYFGYPPRDAALLDPQHRLLLETAVHALEDAGYGDPAGLPVGVFAGTSLSTYLLRHLSGNPEVGRTAGYGELILANDKDTLATRVSYHLDLRGPSMTVQTACSTSLVAVHLAAQALLARDCDLALAGGVSVQVPQAGYRTEPGGVLSEQGRCRPFDAHADGIVPGSGAALVVLKRLVEAVRDRDTVHAVVLGSAVNNDGAAKVGFTAPGLESQVAVIRDAQRLAAIDVAAVGYVEAHGTGTPLGDPIEVAALTRAFRAVTDQRGYCALGSVKALIGHLDAAAGVAGLVKAVLALRAGVLPPSPHIRRVNPALDLAAGPFHLPAVAQPWPPLPGRRIAGVTALGMGGTNAHVVLQQAPPAASSAPSPRRWHLLPLSARSPAALDALRANLADHLEDDDAHAGPGEVRFAPDLADVAHTLQVGRRPLAQRAVLLCRDAGHAVRMLRYGGDGVLQARQDSRDTPVAFLFPGQGAQHPGMAQGLYEHEAVVRHWLDRAAAVLRGHGVDLLDLLYGGGSAAAEQLTRTANAQPALFAVEYALAQLWWSWGVRPTAMIGHSVGEYTAACLADVFSFDDALGLVAARGALMDRLPAGAMLAVGRPADEVQREMESAREPEAVLGMAVDNAPSGCVVAGQTGAVERFAERMRRQAVPVRRLHVSHAFHSPMVEPMLEAFAARVAAVQRGVPRIPFVAGVTGDWITAGQAADPWYWARQASSTVRFRDGAALLLRRGQQVLIEVGPGRTLCTLVREQGPEAAAQTVVPSLARRRPPGPNALGGGDADDDVRSALSALARAWLGGADVDWAGHWPEPRRRVPLPGYPFQRQRYWIDPPAAWSAAGGSGPDAAGLPVPVAPVSPSDPDAAPEAAPARHDEVADQVRLVLAESLGLPDVGPQDDFFALGGTSLGATRVVARLNDLFPAQLPAACLFDTPTAEGLADLVWRRLAAEQDDDVHDLIEQIRQLSPDALRAALDEDNAVG